LYIFHCIPTLIGATGDDPVLILLDESPGKNHPHERKNRKIRDQREGVDAVFVCSPSDDGFDTDIALPSTEEPRLETHSSRVSVFNLTKHCRCTPFNGQQISVIF